jgi:colicin import membrane protein
MDEMKTAVEARPVRHVVDYSITDDALALLRQNYHGLSAETTAGYEQVRKAIADLRQRRVAVEAKRKELKADALEYGRKVDGEAERITSALEAIEAPLKREKQRVDDEAERRRRAVEDAKRQKIEAELRAAREAEEAKARAARAEEEARLAAEREKLAAERAAMEAERAEETKRQQAERARIEAEQKAERARIEAEQKAAMEKVEAERHRMETERKRIEAEQKAEREKLEAERRRLACEEAARQAKLDAEREAIARAAREKEMEERRKVEAAELAARLEALKPDAAKLAALPGIIRTVYNAFPEMATQAGLTRLHEIKQLCEAAARLAERELKP